MSFYLFGYGNIIATGNFQSNSSKINCPSSFTSIEAQGRQLGCIQNTERSTGTCQEAILDCFETYGGKLPS